MKKSNIKYQILNIVQGQSLFELVVAIAISALVIVAMVSLATNSIKNSIYSKNKALASSYAQQATEWLRGQRDSDITTFGTNTTAFPKYCLPNLDWIRGKALEQDCTFPITGTVFKRWVIFNVTSPDGKTIVEANVAVSWTDSVGTHEINSATNFSDWRQR